jgi:hypothetical protein
MIKKFSDKKLQEMFEMSELLQGWQEFKRGKIHKDDVSVFVMNLYDNFRQIHTEIGAGGW